MRTQLTESRHRRAVPVRRFNIVPVLAIIVIGAIGAALTLLFPMDWVHTPKVTLATEWSAISPNGDGNQDTLPIVYSISEDATVTIDVLDENQALVRVLVEEQPQPAGQHTVVWDGLDRVGQALPDGKYLVRVSARATVQSSSSTVPVEIDTTPPVIRLANLPENTQVGAGSEKLRIEGVTDPDATVWLNHPGQPLEVGTNGSFTVLYTLQEGVNRIELVAVDRAGNQASVVREVTLRTLPPDLVVLNPPDGLWINQRMLSVQGKVTAGVKVRVNGNDASVDEEGKFDVDVVLEEGENVVRVEAIDAVGNASVEERRVYLRTRPPALSLTTVRDGMTVREPSFLVVGRTEPQTLVRLNGRELAVDSQGGFQGLVNLVEGENIIRVEALDRAGNTNVVVREVTYSPKQPATSLPPAVRNVLAAAGLGVAGVTALWLISGLWQRPLSLVLRVTRDTLTPGMDGRLEPAVVVFELSRPATVTAEVWDLNNRHVATVFRNQRRSQGEHLLVWDGRDSDGRIASPGTYEVEVSASTLFTTVSSSTRLMIEAPAMRPAWERGQVERRAYRE
jgi:flagellar hook assembly protein FlgD